MTGARVEGRWAPLARIVLVGLAFVAGFLVVYVVTVRTVRGRLFGDASLRGALLTRSAFADVADRVLDVVSVASLLAALALVVTIALVRLERATGIAAVGLIVGANGSAQVLKRFLLDRPDLGISEVTPSTLNSLPSGHVTVVFSAVAAFVLVVPVRWRFPASLAGLGLAVLTALATMSAGWHRAGDAMAAFLVVGTWVALAALVVRLVEPRAGTRVRFAWPAATRRLAAVATASVALGLVLGALLDLAGPVRETAVGSWVAFVLGGLLITGTGIAVLLGMLQVLADLDASRATGPG